MKSIAKFYNRVPKPFTKYLRPIRNKIVTNKGYAELMFWESRYQIDNGVFQNSHYQRLMQAIAEEPDDNFIKGKIIADFGCGPRGSLAWAKSASLRIGIDVLADQYSDHFKSNILSHDMVYLKSTEKTIPLPSDFLDILFTINAIDHVNNFPVMCKEIIRVIKPGGDFIASINLNEPPTNTEPQVITEEYLNTHLLSFLKVKTYRITNMTSKDRYAPFFEGNLQYTPGSLATLWVKATKV